MKLSKQQKETKEFFHKNSKKWKNNVMRKSTAVINVVEFRNQYVRNLVKNKLQKKSRILDVGCGSGELVIDLLKQNHNAIGIDFAKSMIDIAKKDARKSKLPTENFIHGSFFDEKFDEKFDLIIANGFIEYISEKELKNFIKIAKKNLKKNGILILHARNRLFNVFSFNEYTKDEIKNNNINQLIRECVYFNELKSIKKIHSIDLKFKKNLVKHKHTGINVNIRNQYTPLQLHELLENNEFKVFDIFPINIHVFTTGARNIIEKKHNNISNEIQKLKNVPLQFIPQSSSFMITSKNE